MQNKTIQNILIIFCLLATAYSSGEPVALGREIRTVYLGQEFTISIVAPDQQKNPDYWYVTTKPQINEIFVQYLNEEETAATKGIDPRPPKKIYHFKAVKNGVMMTDIVHYDIGKWMIGGIAGKLFVHKKVKEIFDYRYRLLESYFNKG